MEIPELIKAGQAFRGESDQYAELITELADALAATVVSGVDMIEDAKALAGHAQTVGLERDDPLILELAETVWALVKEMHQRELHHFEVEADNANLREVPQKVYNALHVESRERALEILHKALNP